MSIKLVITDIDGTLIDHTENIPDELIQTVQKCKEKGIHFALATGRTEELVLPIIEKLHITEPCVIANGASIYQDGTYLMTHGFSAYPILELIKKADQAGLTVTFSDEMGERAIRQTDYVLGHQKIGGRFKSYVDVNAIDWKQKQFQKIMFMDENRTGQIEYFQEELRKYSDYYWITTYSDLAVELGPKECNKATGLDDLTQILGISMNEVMACGDFLNDLEMVNEAGIGVAVGNAAPELKNAADYTAKAEYCYGVIEAVEKFCF